MKKTLFYIITLAFFALSFSFKGGGGIKFNSGDWRDVTKEAQSKNKPIFAMVCASWCSNCARMKAEVFTDKEVGEYFNEKFVSTIIDSEDFKNNMRVTSWGVKSVPTMVILVNKKVVYLSSGFKDKNKLLEEAEKALGASASKE